MARNSNVRPFRLLLLVLLITLCAFAQTGLKYTIQDLGYLPGYPNCSGTGLSQTGLVTGYCFEPGGSMLQGSLTHGFLYAEGVLKDLGASSMAVVPTGVNDSGIVIGSFFQGTRGNVVFVGPFWNRDGVYQTSGAMSALPGAPKIFVPFALSNSGQVAGTLASSPDRSFIQMEGSKAYQFALAGVAASELPMPGAATSAGAVGLSRDGTWSAGGARGSGRSLDAFLWRDGDPVALGRLSGYPFHMAIAVNDAGTAAGSAFDINYDVSYDLSGIARGVLFKGGAATDLGLLSGTRHTLPVAINRSEQVVGFSTSNPPTTLLQLAALALPASNEYRAFLYENGTLSDLLPRVVNGSGWQLSFATAINDAGQIVGTGYFQGSQRAFLLNPVLPPKVSSAVGAGLSVPASAKLAPNGLFTLFGTGFADAGVKRNVGQADLVDNALPPNLSNTCVQSGTARWGLVYVSATQVNALAGELPASGTVPVSVVSHCGTANEIVSDPITVAVAPAAPEFLYFVQNADGQNPVAAIQASSGAYVGPEGLIAGARFTPARVNDIITIFAVGLGATDPPSRIGALAPQAASITSTYSLTIGGVAAQVLYAGVTPTYAGLYQVNAVLPQGLGAGNLPVVLTVNGVASPAGAYLAVGP